MEFCNHLRGARQVGKTFLIKQFAKNEYEDFVYLDFDLDPELKRFFSKSLKPERIIRELSIYFNKKIEEGSTLIVFDEIQESPEALNQVRAHSRFFRGESSALISVY